MLLLLLVPALGTKDGGPIVVVPIARSPTKVALLASISSLTLTESRTAVELPASRNALTLAPSIHTLSM